MPEVQFHQTRMGQLFYEHTMPELVRQLTRLNDLLDKGLKVAGVSSSKTSSRDQIEP